MGIQIEVAYQPLTLYPSPVKDLPFQEGLIPLPFIRGEGGDLLKVLRPF